MFGATGDDCSDYIPRLEALDLFCPFGFGAGKANLVDVAFLPAAMSCCRDQERNNPGKMKLLRRALAHARRIEPVLFREVSHRSIKLRQTPRTTFDRHSQCLESFVQDPSDRVHGGCILERRFGLSQNAYKQFRFLAQEKVNIPGSFGLIAGVTGQTKVVDTISSPCALA